MSTVTNKKIEIDGINVFYRETGPEDGPTVLLLHGWPSSSHMFRNLIPLLEDRFHVIAPDYPGFGHSDSPTPSEFSYTFDNISNLIDRVPTDLEDRGRQSCPVSIIGRP